MQYDTLIFDLDGTLVDPVVGIVRCMNYALTSMDFPPRNEKEITPYIGPPLQLALRGLSGTDDDQCVEQLIVAYRERYGEFGYLENTVYEGIHTMLGELKSHNLRLGVCTSKYHKYAIKILKEFNLFEYFDFVSGSDYHVAKSEQLAELLSKNTITKNAVMIGDRNVDLTAAHANDLRGIGLLWGYGSRAELEAEKPDFIAKSPQELTDYLLAHTSKSVS